MAGTTLPETPGYMATLATDHFYVKYNPQGKVPLTATLDESLAAYEKVNQFFQGYHNKTTLVVADSYNEYRLITGIGDIPENATACDFNDGPRGTVLIKSPDLVPNYRQVLTYHMARIMERTIMQEYHNPPEWFQDGLAAYVASDITEKQRAQAAEEARAGRWMNLTQLEKVYANKTVYNENSAESKAARAQSYLLVEYVGSTYGNRTLVNILDDFGYCGDINRSFQNRTSGTPEEFNQNLRKVLIGPVNTATPTTPVDEKEYLSGYARDGVNNPIAGKDVRITGGNVNTTVTTDKNGYYAAEVDFGVLNVSVTGEGYRYENTVAVNPGENKVFNITIAGLNTKQATSTLPAMGLPAMPSLGDQGSIAAMCALMLANLLALAVMALIMRRNI